MTDLFRSNTLRLACLAAIVNLSACSTIESTFADDRIDYRHAAAAKPNGLDVPPDLSQLSRDSRYQPVAGSVSAAKIQATPVANASALPQAATPVLPALGKDIRLARDSQTRWLVTPQTPEQVWPQLQGFWKDIGLPLVREDATTGVMETEWAENRAKLPNDVVRNTIGKVFDSLWSTGERDKYIVRLERVAGGTEIYLSHRGMQEVYTNERKDNTIWQPKAADPQLEADMLQRMALRLSGKELGDKAALALVPVTGADQSGGGAAPKARAIEGQASIEVDDAFDRAWRRVGLALDRGGFTVEDRDRSQGLYFVRYIDPGQAGKEEPGFFAKLFNSKDQTIGLNKYRVQVKSDGAKSTVNVLDAQGQPEKGEAGQRIAKILLKDLR